MLREKCLRCGSSDVYHGRLMGQSGITLLSAQSLFRTASATQCLACVTCGGLEPYLDDKAIGKLRAWKAAEQHQYAGPRTEGIQPTMRWIPVAIALAIAGFAAAMAAQLMHIGEKINGH
jgi:hypothetical protein